jgi:predicted nucleotidyltransferase
MYIAALVRLMACRRGTFAGMCCWIMPTAMFRAAMKHTPRVHTPRSLVCIMDLMAQRRATNRQLPWRCGTDVPMSAIRRFAREVAKQFYPQKIILFGSHAYGKPHADSDVDVLVIMPTRNTLDQAARISLAIDPPFPLDIIVRTPSAMRWRLAEGDSFLTEITSQGKVLYEAADGRVGAKGRSRLPRRKEARRRQRSRTGAQ